MNATGMTKTTEHTTPFAAPLSADLTDAQFEQISKLVKGLCGINLHWGKRELVRARLTKRLRKLKISTFEEYLERLDNEEGGAELTAMLNALSTNLTHFYREAKHFDYLRSSVLPALQRDRNKNRRIRIWSAGCSSGEEAYSIAMCLSEEIADLDRWDVKVLATDLATDMLEAAREGMYAPGRLKELPPKLLAKYLVPIKTKSLSAIGHAQAGERRYRVADSVRRLVSFARLNLMGYWPMKGPFDVIFCRNVMIYFDKPTQNELINRFWGMLPRGGTLFIGHSESLTGVRHSFRYVQPTVYEKP